MRITEIDLVVEEFVDRDQGGFGQTLVELGDLDLFAVLEDLFQAVVVGGELLDLLVEFLFHLRGDLVGTFGKDGNGLIDVACAFVKLIFLTGDYRRFGSDFLEIHGV